MEQRQNRRTATGLWRRNQKLPDFLVGILIPTKRKALVAERLDLVEPQLRRGVAAKHGHNDTHRATVHIERFDRADKARKLIIHNADTVADVVAKLDLPLLYAHRFDLFVGQRDRSVVSITRSVTTVPSKLEKGTFSYLLTTPQRVNSPIRGIARLAK